MTYTLAVVTLPRAVRPASDDVILLVTHLGEDVLLWVNDQPTRARGRTRQFESPPLTPGEKYRYQVHAAWLEGGRRVHQIREVSARPGEAVAVYLTLSPSSLARKRLDARIAANLAMLSPRDQEVARLQRTCAVNEGARLGEAGVPIKVMVSDHRVFVCNADCVKKALADPDQTWAIARQLRNQGARAAVGK